MRAWLLLPPHPTLLRRRVLVFRVRVETLGLKSAYVSDLRGRWSTWVPFSRLATTRARFRLKWSALMGLPAK